MKEFFSLYSPLLKQTHRREVSFPVVRNFIWCHDRHGTIQIRRLSIIRRQVRSEERGGHFETFCRRARVCSRANIFEIGAKRTLWSFFVLLLLF